MRGAEGRLGAATAAVFAATSAWAAAPERGVAAWDGAPSFGGAWIAHGEAGSRPSRVRVASADGGETEAVPIRAGSGVGTGFTVSAAVARALDLAPGRPATLILTSVDGSGIPSPEGTTGNSEPRSDAPASAEDGAAQARPDETAPAAAEPPEPRREDRSSPPRTRASALASTPRASHTDRVRGALVEARAPRPRPGASEAPSASPRPLGRPGPGTPS